MKLGEDMNRGDLEIKREWGFASPEGEEWPPEVALTTRVILCQQSNPFFSVLLDTAYMIHESDAGLDAEQDYFRMLGMVELLTDMVVTYCMYQLGGRQPDAGIPDLSAEELYMLRTRARAVVGQLLHYVKEHSPRGR